MRSVMSYGGHDKRNMHTCDKHTKGWRKTQQLIAIHSAAKSNCSCTRNSCAVIILGAACDFCVISSLSCPITHMSMHSSHLWITCMYKKVCKPVFTANAFRVKTMTNEHRASIRTLLTLRVAAVMIVVEL